MADRYRNDISEYVTLNCKIKAEAKAYLIEIAGEFGLGKAIEDMVERDRKRTRRPTKAQHHVAGS